MIQIDKPTLEKPPIKKRRKGLKDFFDFRNNQINQIGLILFAAFVIATSLHFFFENRFTEEQWKTRPMTRHKIVNDLIDDRVLVNKSKLNVIELLGQPSLVLKTEKDVMLYELGLAPELNGHEVEYLYIEYRNDTVYKVSFALYNYN